MEKSSESNIKARAFLKAFRVTASVTAAAHAVGCSRDLHYRWLADKKGYREAFELAKEQAAQSLEDEAIRRAHSGIFKPNIWKGDFCYPESEYELDAERSTKRRPVYKLKDGAKPRGVLEYSDALLMFMLRGARPERYRERAAVEIPGSGNQIAITITQADADL
jgi:hypothetical protein